MGLLARTRDVLRPKAEPTADRAATNRGRGQLICPSLAPPSAPKDTVMSHSTGPTPPLSQIPSRRHRLIRRLRTFTAWAPRVFPFLFIAAGLTIGLTGPTVLGVALIGAGAMGGSIQITVHVRR